MQLTSTIIPIVPGVPFATTFLAYYCAGTSYIVNPLLFGWANIILKRGGDGALRSVILTSMNAASPILYVYWGIILYQESKALYWRNGCIRMLVVIVFFASMLGVVKYPDQPLQDALH